MKERGGRVISLNGKRSGGWLQKGRGWERKKPGGTRGNPRVWRLGGLGPELGYSLAILKTFLFCKFNLAINFRKRRRLSR